MSIERYVDFYCGRSKMDEKKNKFTRVNHYQHEFNGSTNLKHVN